MNKNLLLTVEDNGPGLAKHADKHETGIGVLNTMNRLEILYDWHEYSMKPSLLGGLAVEIKLPFIES
jgi:sensor histidine kinase YesM